MMNLEPSTSSTKMEIDDSMVIDSKFLPTKQQRPQRLIRTKFVDSRATKFLNNKSQQKTFVMEKRTETNEFNDG